MVNKQDLEESVKKLLVRLKNLEEGKQLGTMVQIMQDLLFLAHTEEYAAELFEDKNVHEPLMLVLSTYSNSKVGWSLLCRLMEICPATLDKLVRPLGAGSSWEVLGLLVLLLEEEMDVFELVVEAMKTFPESEEVQLQGCSALRLTLTAFLWCVWVAESNVEILMSKTEKCYSLVCEAVEACSQSEAVQEVGCCLLQKLTSGGYFTILVLNGVHRLAVNACLSYPDNATIQTAAFSCLAALTKSIVENKSLEREVSEEEDERMKEDGDGAEESLVWRDACCIALERHTENEKVQEAACWALNSLLLYGNAHSHVYVEPPVHTQIMAVMLLHSSNVRVFQAATSTLGTLIRRHSKMRSLLLSHGIHYNIVELMKRHADSSEVCESACKFLHILFQGGRVSLDDSVMALGRILISMKDHNFEPEVQLEGLRVSLVLLNPGKSFMQCPMASTFLVQMVWIIYTFICAHMQFISSEEIQVCGLGVLSALADCSGAVDVMCQQGAIDTVLHTLQMFPRKRDIHYWGLSLLFHLISKKKLSRMIVPVLASVLVTSVRQHKEDAAMLLKLQKLSCLCLSKMVVDSDIRYRLLERACEEGDVVMAECLIQLGADVNKKAKTESLIHQVCEHGPALALVEVLVDGGVHEQQLRGALAVCVKRGDGPVVTFLLGRLGLKPTRNALCLGGFKLGRLETSWISGLLLEQRAPSTLRVMNTAPAERVHSMELQRQCLFIAVVINVIWLIYQFKQRLISSLAQIKGVYLIAGSDQDQIMFSPQVNRFRLVSVRLELLQHLIWISFYLKCAGMFFSETSSPGGPLSGVVNGHITLLDLSGNELDSLSCFMGDSVVQQQLKHLLHLDLSGNKLSEIPSTLCESLQNLTRLDLQDNQLKSLPAELLSLPSLSTLSVAQNCVGPVLFLKPHVRCPTLRQLNLSFNCLTAFPYQLGQAMENLEDLNLEGNQISELSLPLCLAEMKALDVSKNGVAMISDDFLSGCFKLETFSASNNKLSSMSHLPSKITTLKLSQNNFKSVPYAVLNLPNLRSVDMKSNSISVLPGPSAWASANLKELLFSQNQIAELDLREPVQKWARLEKLQLSNNKLTEIPPQIGLLEELTSLDVSGNVGLRSFPDELGKLVRLWDLPLDGLQLQLDLKHIGNKTKDIVRYFQQRLKKAVPYFRMKLIVVGTAGSGKTTLIQQLMKHKRSQWKSGIGGTKISVRDWTVRDRDKKNMILNVWDIPGEILFESHPHFMSSRAMYLVLYNLSKGVSELDTVKPWLFNIKALAPLSPVILVGTHVDMCEDHVLQECMQKLREDVGFPAIKESHILCACEESDSISKLRKSIASGASCFKIQGQPVMGQLVPDCYVELERRVLQERTRVPPEFPVLRHQRLLQLIQESQLHLEEGELPHAIRFLSETGVLLHFDDPALQLRDLYFIDPQWLCNVISQVTNKHLQKHCYNTTGVVLRSVLTLCLSESRCFPREHLMQYFKLLEKFQIALPFGDEQLLIPSSLLHHKPVINLPHSENSEMIMRIYEMPYFPMGYWSRQINRLLEVSAFMLCGREIPLKPTPITWRTGIYLTWDAETYCLVEAYPIEKNPSSFVKVTVPCSRKGQVLLGQVVDHIDSVLEEWYPDLLNTDIHGDGETVLKKWALYSFNDAQEQSKMQLEELLKNGLLVNKEDPQCTIPISQICPDLILIDQPASTMLDPEELEKELSKEYLLGDGGFGSVYRAIYKNEDVAIKIFNKHASELYVHRLVRQELTVLGRLNHPSLVALLAAGSSPHVLVMELAPCGSLDSLFENKDGSFSRKLKHRIALQVADGLRYLHSSMIIYRDLKPHNVLLFTLKTDSEIIAKITDYGIVQYCCSMGVKSSEGTPGFRAPEVARGNVIYDVQADVYSFGLLLYDLLTCGQRISDGVKFPSEFDEIAVQGKLPDPVEHYHCSPWSGFQNLMKDCLNENPQDRPTSAQVFDRLSSGEMLCLIRELTLDGLPCECFVVSCVGGSVGRSVNGGAGARVWMGGGSSSQKLGCVTCVDLETEKSTRLEIDQSPVLCLVTVRVPEESHDWLVAGTQLGSLVVMDTKNAQVLHHLQSVKDSVTSFCLKKYLLVGTADGTIVIYEDAVIKCADGAPVKVVKVGNVNTPLMCLGLSGHSQDRSTIWAGCGTKAFSLSVDYSISKTIDTWTAKLFVYACISRLVVEKHIYLSKTGGHIVEVWDKKSGKMIDLIDCVQLLRKTKLSCETAGIMESSWACVKTLLVQHNGTLWIGTRAGHILLVDLSTRELLQAINPNCHSVRSMASVLIEQNRLGKYILVLNKG
uniref:non-specific serine/threonine protein kinase n=1 Tax=Astyanax mexicanus TaxID=7994 RepID=A0A8B9GY88_ASTMX